MTKPQKWYGSADLQPLLVPIEDVSPYPGNPRQGDVGAISASIERFGQTKPLAVQLSSGHIVAGNHAWWAMRGLGWTHVAVARSAMTDKDALAYLVADNRTEELGSYEYMTLGAILQQLAQDDNLAGTGYDGDDVDALLKSLESEENGPGAGGGRGRTKPNSCMVCGAIGERFQLKLQWVEGEVEHARGAGSIVLCSEDWLAHAQPNMRRPVDSLDALKSLGDEADEDVE